ncbi:hypothetical protein GOBAR_AA15790 [Gossypium barbadense]|uniref:non-specific serine/threonine protein kinase n=1 Tax=Gossypium barbadense TaxID=3634 RepID=A0A2P5XNF6_GOSBA|nr:hypothetical protein GOBAR_AA15790 [Gossypium barbadense]
MRKKTRTVGKYEVGRTIGQGTFAKVKFARNSVSGESVALKVLPKATILKHRMVDQIKREISIMKIVRHPNIVRLHEVHCGRLPENECRRYFQQLIDAVAHCHSKGVYHRDLKPENLLLDSYGDLKVSDFGLSALLQQGVGLLHTTCGTPNYVAPEVLSNQGYDGAAADIWSCGVILFFIMAGYLPFYEIDIPTLYKKSIKGCQYEIKRPVTRSYAKAHNNLVSEPAVMGDEKTLTAKLEAFMEQMATRQQALEEQNKAAMEARKEIQIRNTVGPWCHDTLRWNFPLGVGDPLGWLKRCKNFFGNQRTNEEDKVDLASFHLLREAQLWFDQIEKEEANLDWERFRECCHIRFGPPMSNNPLGELANLRQTGTVEEYQRQFQSLLARTTDLKPRQQVNLFTAGLVGELRIDIEMQQPGNLGVAMNMARALERKQKDQYVSEQSVAKEGGPLMMNAFEMITLSQGLNLSSLFDRQQDYVKRQTRFVSRKPPRDIISSVEAVAESMGLKVHTRNYKTRLERISANKVGEFAVVLEVFEVAPSLFMADVRKASGDTLEYHKQFYKNFCTKLENIIWKPTEDVANPSVLRSLTC